MVTAFWTMFCLTVALLAATLWAGFRHRRRLHYGCAISSVAALTVTVILTEQLVRVRDFESIREQLDFHKMLAKIAAGLVLPVIATGLALIKRPKFRRLHLVCVFLFLAMVLVATGTGIWVYSMSGVRPPL